MIQHIKNILKRFLPPPVHAFNREVKHILDTIESGNREQKKEIAYLSGQIKKQQEAVNFQNEQMKIFYQSTAGQLASLAEMLEKVHLSYQKDLKILQNYSMHQCEESKKITVLDGRIQKEQEIFGNLEKQMREWQKDNQKFLQQGVQLSGIMTEQAEKICSDAEKNRLQAAAGTRSADEAVWASIFNNTITGSTWLKNQVFSPGRWAVGYPFLYAMYRVLDEIQPKHILELGLGQSTKMIAQYTSAYGDAEHFIVEHDQEWIDFFCADVQLSERTHMIKLDREMIPFREAGQVRVFKDFQQTFKGKKFDFISIDAPLGGDMKQYSRIDVLRMLPECLAENFVIMMDDYERSGEIHTAEAMEKVFKEQGIGYRKGMYRGQKDCILICAEHMGFLTSM